jgi:hypothetical protein
VGLIRSVRYCWYELQRIKLQCNSRRQWSGQTAARAGRGARCIRGQRYEFVKLYINLALDYLAAGCVQLCMGGAGPLAIARVRARLGAAGGATQGGKGVRRVHRQGLILPWRALRRAAYWPAALDASCPGPPPMWGPTFMTPLRTRRHARRSTTGAAAAAASRIASI